MPARQRLYNHLHTMLFGPFFTTPVAQPPDRFKAALLARLWAISPTLAVISLLSLARGLAEKQARANGNDEAVALKAALEGAARAAKLLSPLAQFAHHMLVCPSPTLAVDAALALTDPEADAELRTLALEEGDPDSVPLGEAVGVGTMVCVGDVVADAEGVMEEELVPEWLTEGERVLRAEGVSPAVCVRVTVGEPENVGTADVLALRE